MPAEPVGPGQTDSAGQEQLVPQVEQLVDVDEVPHVVVVPSRRTCSYTRARCLRSDRSKLRGGPLHAMCKGSTITPVALATPGVATSSGTAGTWTALRVTMTVRIRACGLHRRFLTRRKTYAREHEYLTSTATGVVPRPAGWAGLAGLESRTKEGSYPLAMRCA